MNFLIINISLVNRVFRRILDLKKLINQGKLYDSYLNLQKESLEIMYSKKILTNF